MPKHTRSADADDFGSIDIALKKQKPAREFEGTDDQPVDADTGESLFEDINPRIRTWGPKGDKAPKNPAPEDDEDLDEEIDEELDQDDEDEPEAEEALESDEEPIDEDESADEEEDEPPARDKKKSKTWSRRLERAERLRQEAEANSAELLKRLDAVEQTQKVHASESEYASAKTELESKIADVREKLTTAMDDGTSSEQLALTEELTELKSELRAKKDKFEAAKAAVAASKTAGPSPIIARRVSAWTRKHPRYGTDKVFQDFVKSNDREVANAGFNPESEDYYKELDRRIKERYPEEYGGRPGVKPKTGKGAEQEASGKVRSKHPSASFRRDNAATTKTKGGFKMRGTKVQLTDRQKANMRAFQLDPENPNDVRDYVTNNL